ncbi:type I-B CRISPR-associated protein Cas7/Csh2 [Paenibacillus alginolyticus]|uniref:Type I-B CRISPR-associated protein Cas7/Csh2 n=1 Tax=Paenibacillus alginolyticus TaxID=59839 RepID=A0ABT4G7H6_9BACL|nr:type I-B CRISPR-associated protein Cas7/Csh2 [Paenibacillus alginolyticus]MCY9692094.1 type I-B CRISPR-associated protein Cas7/Csh2 [Paenibacillus alginolyticus]MEC0147859.1 type I-B CRISPR-associated protein Cas7/Csh2 [Paenibacillus alginolyticus]
MIKNRSELVFLYDASWINPNGDPVDENKPRFDEETGRNLVTDVRIKRTIRDYLHLVEGKEIFVREISDDEGAIQDGKQRAADFLVDDNGVKLTKGSKKEKSTGELSDKAIIRNNVLKDCIDVRLFGATIPLDKDSITLTGPVQFKLASSLHRAKLEYIKGTGAFASKEGNAQKTFREEYVVAYSLLNVYGILNENCAKDTKLQEEDVELLLRALWNGTKSLHSRSKVGQMPRILFKVEYSKPHYHIGELDKGIKMILDEGKLDQEIRDVEEYQLDFTNWLDRVGKHKDHIAKISFAIDDRVRFSQNPVEALQKLGIPTEQLSL